MKQIYPAFLNKRVALALAGLLIAFLGTAIYLEKDEQRELEALFAGPVSGASMNPARSIGPAVLAWRPETLNVLWLYIVAPVLGAVISVPWCRCIQPIGVREPDDSAEVTS